MIDNNKDESGTNSETDLLEIKGEALGTTEIITVNSNGEEKILDGSIGELEDKLAISKPVVRVDNDTTGGTAFTGKVKLANLWVDFTNNTGINVGKDKLQESYDKIWLEIGLGGQREVKKDTYLYADARLEKGLNRFGVKGTIGIKKSW